MEIKIISAKEKDWLDKWDDFVLNENKASHLLLSDWNKSFEKYGFIFEICLLLSENKIVGGFSAVVAKAAIFKFYVVPYGPIISTGYMEQMDRLLAIVKQQARKNNCCYCHVSLPISKNINKHTFNEILTLVELSDARMGHVFKYVYSSFGLNWIDLNGFSEESKIMTLKPSVRRNIRNSYRKGLELKRLNTNTEIENGYKLFLENSKASNYSIRDWGEMKNTLFSLNDKGFLKMLAAYKDGELKGAILLLKGGNYYTYILGGSKKEVPDLRTGDFLQWEAIKMSLDEDLDGYNISLGGSIGVVEFKNSFNTEQFYFKEGSYYWVIKPIYFNLFLALEKHLKPHKKTISKLLSKLKW